MSRRSRKLRARDAAREEARPVLWLLNLAQRTDPLSTLALLEGAAVFFGDDRVCRERPPIDTARSKHADVRRASRDYLAAVELYRGAGRDAYRHLAGEGKRGRLRRACDWLIVVSIHSLVSPGGLAVPTLCDALAEAWNISPARVERAWKRRGYGRATRRRMPR